MIPSKKQKELREKVCKSCTWQGIIQNMWRTLGNSLVVQCSGAFTAEAQVQSLVREIRPHSLTEQEKKQNKTKLLQLDNKKINNPNKKWEKDLNRHFSRKDIQIPNKHTKRNTASWVTKERKIKTAMNSLQLISPQNSCHIQPLWKVWQFFKKSNV